MDKILVVAASSDLAKSYISYIEEDSALIDVIVRETSRLENLERFDNIYNYDLEEEEFFNPKNTSAWFFYDIFRNPYFFLKNFRQLSKATLPKATIV